MTWLLLLHQIPPTPSYLRAKILRKLNQLGAYPIKNSAYLLPDSTEHMEDLQWVRTEIAHEGGEAWVFRVDAVAGISDDVLKQQFRDQRAAEYKQLCESASALLQSVREAEPNNRDGFVGAARKLEQRFRDVRSIDFFDAPGREELEATMASITNTLQQENPRAAAKPQCDHLTGKIWVTRRGVKVDRIATAWLILRFIDPQARFLFVDPDRHSPAPEQIRFDMFEGEFTHEGELCTFEVLLRHLRLADPALEAIAQIVHDLDLKCEQYQRPETSGFAMMIAGIAAMHADDHQRINEGSRVLNAMYAALRPSSKG